MKRKKKELPEYDDGRVIADMNVEGMPWYRPDADKKVKDEDKPSRKETWALIRAGFAAYFPRFIVILIGFGLAFCLCYFWLHGWSL